ncbi:MAG TPA: magnesium transporter, partial [Bacillota bacterium]|nr:magnesium transporter [Bacillota bacterium]
VTHDDREKAAQMLSKYDFLSLPVVDTENRLVGIITVDDAIDVIRDETTEDIEKMAAITPTDKPYLKTGVFSTWLKRIPWLVLLMISATFTSKIIGSYEDALSKLVILTAFIPMLMDTGGNAGSQAAMTIIRGLSIGEIVPRDIFKIFWKEVRVALLCGMTLAVVGFAKLLIVDQASVTVAFVVALTMCITIVAAKTVGCTLPLLAKKIGFDPAVMASPFITTIVDAISLLIYFSIATAMLPALSS